MANVKFELDCPKCDEPIVIRSTAQIGKKVECPKCKYRFTVPEMDDEGEDDDAPASKGKKAKSGSGLLIGIVLGVLALGGLGLGAVLMFGGGGGGDNKPVAQTPTNSGNPQPTMPTGSGTDGATPPGPETPGGNDPPKKPTKKPRPTGLKEITNLLPGEATSVWHLRMDELSRTPLYASIFDRATQDLFTKSMTFNASDIDEILHCYTGPDKDAFAIIRTKGPLDTDEMTKRLDLETPKNNVVKGRDFYLLKSNAFLTAISKSLSLGAIMGMEGKAAKARQAKPAEERKLAFSIYDNQTIVLADPFVMERFLNDLKEDGLPPFKSELTQPEPVAPPMGTMPPGGMLPGGMLPGGMPPGGMPPGGMLPGGAKGGASAPRRGGDSEDAQAQPTKPGGPMGNPMFPGNPMGNPMFPGNPMGGPMGNPMFPGGPMGPPPVRKSFTSNPFFRTIEPDLKRALNTLEDDDRETPGAVYVQRVEQRSLSDLDLRSLGLPELADGVLVSWLQQVKVLGFSITAMDKSKGIASGYFEYVSEDDAKKSVNEHVLPVLNALKLLYILQTKENVTIRDLTQGGQGNTPGTGPMFPGGNPMFPGGNPMFPGSGTGPPGGLTPLKPPGSPGGGTTPTRPGGGPTGTSSPRHVPGGRGGEDAQLKPLQPPGSPGSGTPPTSPGNPMFPGGNPMFPGGNPMFPDGNPGGTPGGTPPAGSHIDVSLSDTVVSVQFELEWQETTYQSIVLPGLGRMTAQLKGRMSVLSGENDAFSLADSLKKIIKDKGSFPQGALERDVRTERYGLPYPPEQRVSLFADLLPYLGKAGLRTSIQDKKFAWYAKENLPAAEAWVPEFLVPYYDQSAWRATHELAEGRSLGATNYVGIAGLGLDAARYNPNDPATQKKLGMYGYDWSSKPDQVTDGLSNTIALMQVPPGYQRPWIAGGGATLAGIDERGDKPLQNYVTKMPDGVRGTTILMGDGSVRTVRENINPALLRAMVTRAGGEALDDLESAAPVLKSPKKKTELTAPVTTVKPPVLPKGIDAEELKKFQGTWKAVVLSEGGKDLPAEEVKKEGIEMTFAGTSLVFSEKGRKQEAAEIVKLDPTASPKALDVKPPAGKPGPPIAFIAYEFDGKRLKLVLTKDGKERAKSVEKPKAGDKEAAYIELEKVD